MGDTATEDFKRSFPPLPGSLQRGSGHKVVPIGRHGRPRGEIEAIQRSRILDALVEEVGQKGYEGARVTTICLTAGVSTREFYALYRSKEECFLVALDIGAGIVCEVTQNAFEEATGSWEHRLHVALNAMLETLAANPAFARLSVSEAYTATPAARSRINDVIERVQRGLSCTQSTRGLPEIPGSLLQSALVGSAFRPMIEYAENGMTDRLSELAPVLTYTLALAIVGKERALQEIRAS